MADAVGMDAPTEYDEMLHLAIRWFAKGEREEHVDDRKLSYVTAVDLFFSRPGRGATRRICEGFAFALAPDDDAVPGIARYMFQMFASRSETSHGGRLNVISEDDLKSLRWHVQQFIVAMAKREFKARAQVFNWIGTRKGALTNAQLTALKDATDWRVAEAQGYLLQMGAVIRRLLPLLGDEDASKALRLAGVLQDAARSGGKFIGDVRPLLPTLDVAHNAIVEKLLSGAPSEVEAKTYLDAVVKALGVLPWIADAIR